jgi:hypothetical protein
MEELLDGYQARIRDNLGMTKKAFKYVEDLLCVKSIERVSHVMIM